MNTLKMRGFIVLFLLLASLQMQAQMRNAVPEYLYARFDKGFYIAGEDLWYSIMFMNPQDRQSEIVYVELIDPQGRFLFKQRLKVEDGIAKGDFPLNNDLQTGYYQFRAYTKWNLNFSPQEIFETHFPVYRIELTSQVSQTSGDINYQPIASNGGLLSLDAEEYSPRSKVGLQFSPAGIGNRSAQLSISVIDQSFASVPEQNVQNRASALQSEGFRALKNGQVQSKAESAFEQEFRLIHPESGDPINSNTVFCLVNQSQQKIIGPSTDGIVRFQFENIYDSSLVQIFDANPYQETVSPKVERIDHTIPVREPNIREDLPVMNEAVREYIQQYQQRYQLNLIFGSDQQNRAQSLDQLVSNVTPTTSYKVDDFSIPGGMKVFIKEVVSPVRLKKVKKKKKEKKIDPSEELYFWLFIPYKNEPGDPLLVNKKPFLRVNEYYTTDHKAVQKLEWPNVDRIEVFNTLQNLRSKFGIIGDFGVIGFVTRDGKTPNQIKNAGNYVYVPGFYRPRDFLVPDAAPPVARESRIPDFRPLLYWNPAVKLNAGQPMAIDFPTNDQTGSFLVRIEGVWSDGTPILEEHVFEVKQSIK